MMTKGYAFFEHTGKMSIFFNASAKLLPPTPVSSTSSHSLRPRVSPRTSFRSPIYVYTILSRLLFSRFHTKILPRSLCCFPTCRRVHQGSADIFLYNKDQLPLEPLIRLARRARETRELQVSAKVFRTREKPWE